MESLLNLNTDCVRKERTTKLLLLLQLISFKYLKTIHTLQRKNIAMTNRKSSFANMKKMVTKNVLFYFAQFGHRQFVENSKN